jgi:hypothetical protein
MAEGMAQVVELLPSKWETMSSHPSTLENNRKNKGISVVLSIHTTTILYKYVKSSCIFFISFIKDIYINLIMF